MTMTMLFCYFNFQCTRKTFQHKLISPKVLKAVTEERLINVCLSDNS